MNLRLWQRLFLTFAALSGLALAAFVVWQQQTFRKGFLGYLDEVALERLQPVSERLAGAYAENGSWRFLRGDPGAFADLIKTELRRGLRVPRRRLSPDPTGPDDAPRPPRNDDWRRPPLPRRGPEWARRAHLAELNLLSRLLLVDARGEPVVGDP
jgi:two-component system sensor histidine kinase BaeS